MLRRGIALGVGVLFLIIVVLLIHGCLDSRHKSALRSYNTHVTSIMADNNTKVIQPLFAALTSGSSPAQVLQDLQAVDQVAAFDAKQARGLSVPGEMSHAQTNLELVLDLRSSAVNTITNQITTALSTTGSGRAAQAAVDQITGQMQGLLASDVVYSQRVIPQIKQALDDGGVHGQVLTPSKALNNFGWLDNAQVTSAIGAQVSARPSNGKLAPGTHGHGLDSVKVNNVTLDANAANNNVPGKPAPVFIVAFTNQGENDEVDVAVHVTISGATKTIRLKKVLPQTKAGQPAEARIPLTSPVPTTPVEVKVSIGKVRGEKTTTNNNATYTVTFG
jgi:hypothetical protein